MKHQTPSSILNDSAQACTDISETIQRKWGDDAVEIAAAYAKGISIAYTIRSVAPPEVGLGIDEMMERFRIVFAKAVANTVPAWDRDDYSRLVTSICERLVDTGEQLSDLIGNRGKA